AVLGCRWGAIAGYRAALAVRAAALDARADGVIEVAGRVDHGDGLAVAQYDLATSRRRGLLRCDIGYLGDRIDQQAEARPVDGKDDARRPPGARQAAGRIDRNQRQQIVARSHDP